MRYFWSFAIVAVLLVIVISAASAQQSSLAMRHARYEPETFRKTLEKLGEVPRADTANEQGHRVQF